MQWYLPIPLMGALRSIGDHSSPLVKIPSAPFIASASRSLIRLYLRTISLSVSAVSKGTRLMRAQAFSLLSSLVMGLN